MRPSKISLLIFLDGLPKKSTGKNDTTFCSYRGLIKLFKTKYIKKNWSPAFSACYVPEYVYYIAVEKSGRCVDFLSTSKCAAIKDKGYCSISSVFREKCARTCTGCAGLSLSNLLFISILKSELNQFLYFTVCRDESK